MVQYRLSSFSDSANPVWAAAASASICSTLMPAVHLRRRPQRPRCDSDVSRHRPADAKRRRVTQAGFNPPVNSNASSLFVILMPHYRWTGSSAHPRRCAPVSPTKISFGAPASLISSRNFLGSAGSPICTTAPQPSGGSSIRTMQESNGLATHRTGGQGNAPVRPHPSL